MNIQKATRHSRPRVKHHSNTNIKKQSDVCRDRDRWRNRMAVVGINQEALHNLAVPDDDADRSCVFKNVRNYDQSIIV